MKNRAIWTKLFGIAAVAAIITLTACKPDPDPDPREDFYGEWLCTTGFFQPINVTISAARFHFIDKDNDYVKLEDLTWTPAAYPSHNNDLSATYPAGFNLNGTYTWKGYNSVTPPFFVALLADKNTMLVRIVPSSLTSSQQIFNKQ